MSHCTTFEFSYTDEEIGIKSFERLGMKTSTAVIAEYRNTFEKSFLTKLGYVGKNHKRAIVADQDGYHYFLCDEGTEFKLYIEKHGEITEVDRANMALMELQFRLKYIEVALERVGDRLNDSGIPWRLVNAPGSLTLEFGPLYDRLITLTYSPGGALKEEVSGVSGTKCADLTAELEGLLSVGSTELATTWKPEYQQDIDDEIVQVLRLHQ